MRIVLAVILAMALVSGCLPKQPLGSMFYIESIPAEAEVWVSGSLAGKTPAELELIPGTVVVIKKDGYRDEYADTSKFISGYSIVHLSKLYEVKLSYVPEGSEIWENGNLLGKSPLTVSRIAGKQVFVAKFKHHHDLVDEFVVKGDSFRFKLLKPSVRYFPETTCLVKSEPSGAQLTHYGIDNFTITKDGTVIGNTPLEISNQELSKLSDEHMLVISKDGFAPQVLTGIGSFEGTIKLERKEPFSPAQTKWFSSLVFATGEITSPSKSYTLWAEKRDDKFAVISKKGDLEIDILDMKTEYSDFSGAAWADDRFFVVRGKKGENWQFLIVYDAVERKRFRIEKAGFWHEAIIPGDIEWKYRVPIKPTKVDTFSDLKIEVSKNFSVATFRLFEGKEIEFTVNSDTSFNKFRLVGIVTK